MRFCCGLLLGLICTFVVHVHSQITYMDYEQKLVEAKGDAMEARELADDLLSNGRWILNWNPKTGRKEYRFKPNVADSLGPKLLVAKQ
jgi:hypothetical protein